MPHRRPSWSVLLALPITAACATAAQRTYIAPTPQNVVSETSQAEGDAIGHVISIVNGSTVGITVYSTKLSDCENVKQRCAVHTAALRIGPGSRRVAMRVEPENRDRGFTYRFAFSWRADSGGAAALAALAEGGDARARGQLDDMRRAEALRSADQGPRYHELFASDFQALGSRIAGLRAMPDSVTLAPGDRFEPRQVKLLVVDSAGQVLGETRWYAFATTMRNGVRLGQLGVLIAEAPSRHVVRYSLADSAVTLLGRRLPDVQVPVVVAYPFDPTAPVFQGIAVDSASKKPLGCADIALEDSAANVVARTRSGRTGIFSLIAPRPGTYRVRIEAPGWAPIRAPAETAGQNEVKEHRFAVSFSEQMLTGRPLASDETQHAFPASIRSPVIASGTSRSTPIVNQVTLGGSPTMPILGIITKVSPTTLWAQFTVDTTGVIDSASVALPPGLPAPAVATVQSVLSSVRFSPARESGRPVCELVRMQITLNPPQT